jgi:hypothetical protein
VNGFLGLLTPQGFHIEAQGPPELVEGRTLGIGFRLSVNPDGGFTVQTGFESVPGVLFVQLNAVLGTDAAQLVLKRFMMVMLNLLRDVSG